MWVNTTSNKDAANNHNLNINMNSKNVSIQLLFVSIFIIESYNRIRCIADVQMSAASYVSINFLMFPLETERC